jgi:hypothetical protein
MSLEYLLLLNLARLFSFGMIALGTGYHAFVIA